MEIMEADLNLRKAAIEVQYEWWIFQASFTVANEIGFPLQLT
jgi:hypothetical protein